MLYGHITANSEDSFSILGLKYLEKMKDVSRFYTQRIRSQRSLGLCPQDFHVAFQNNPRLAHQEPLDRRIGHLFSSGSHKIQQCSFPNRSKNYLVNQGIRIIPTFQYVSESKCCSSIMGSRTMIWRKSPSLLDSCSEAHPIQDADRLSVMTAVNLPRQRLRSSLTFSKTWLQPEAINLRPVNSGDSAATAIITPDSSNWIAMPAISSTS